MKVIKSSTILNRNVQDQAIQSVHKAIDSSTPLINALLSHLELAPTKLKSLDVIKNKYSKFAVVGIGGSSLGVQVFTQFFSKNNFTFFDNVDAAEFESQIAALGSLDDVFWLFTSKSGETIETLAALEFIDQIYSENKKNLSQQCLVITEKKQSSLSQWAQERNVLQFEVPLNVGGRYSVLSDVGLVPAYLMGLDIQSLAAGAKRALQDQDSIAQFVAESLESFNRQEWITVLWSYSSRLRNFGLWWQQLWAESLAKKVDLVGNPAARVSTPLSLVGATDQHSVLQQVNEGYHDKFVVFLRLNAAEAGTAVLQKSHTAPTRDLLGLRLGDLLKAEAIATEQSLTESGISNLTLQLDQINEETLGYLIMYMQVSVLSLGQALNLNPLNQPGVERGKVLCKKLLTETELDLNK